MSRGRVCFTASLKQSTGTAQCAAVDVARVTLLAAAISAALTMQNVHACATDRHASVSSASIHGENELDHGRHLRQASKVRLPAAKANHSSNACRDDDSGIKEYTGKTCAAMKKAGECTQITGSAQLKAIGANTLCGCSCPMAATAQTTAVVAIASTTATRYPTS